VATRNAEKKAEQRRISQIGDFKKRMGGEMELPSGLIVKVRNPGGMQAFLAEGLVPNVLMKIIQDGIKKGSAPSAEEIMPEGELDPQLLGDMNKMLDAITIRTIVEPRIAPVITQADLDRHNEMNGTSFTDIEDIRSDDILYVDEIPMDDKQFLFQWIQGGTKDLKTFRQQLDANVVAVAKVQGSKGTALTDSGANAG
jgi:hypothetical protein